MASHSNLRKTLVVAAAVVVDEDGRVLIGKRPEGKAMAGLWEFPGGKVQDGETLTGALVRELAEELGIGAAGKDLRALTLVRHAYPDFDLEMPMFLLTVWQGGAEALDHAEIAWVAPEDLENYAMPPADKPLVRELPALLAKFT